MNDNLKKRLRANGLDECDEAIDRIKALETDLNTIIASAYEAAAREVDCGCAGRAAVLSAKTKTDRWRACGTDPCGAKAAQYVRALTPADAIAARDRDRARVRREALEEAAAWCHANTMDIAMDINERVFAGLYCAGEFTADGGRHSGMGYAAAIRAMIEEEGNA